MDRVNNGWVCLRLGGSQDMASVLKLGKFQQIQMNWSPQSWSSGFISEGEAYCQSAGPTNGPIPVC